MRASIMGTRLLSLGLIIIAFSGCGQSRFSGASERKPTANSGQDSIIPNPSSAAADQTSAPVEGQQDPARSLNSEQIAKSDESVELNTDENVELESIATTGQSTSNGDTKNSDDTIMSSTKQQETTPKCIPKSDPDVSLPAPNRDPLRGFFSSTIVATYNDTTEISGPSGQTSGDGSGARNGFRFDAPTDALNYYSELEITNDNWLPMAGFVGIVDEVHWNNMNWGSKSGVRMMPYLGADFSFGESTGSTIAKDCFSETYKRSDILGIVLNKQNGTMRFYKNGSLISIITNPEMKTATMYVSVADWAFKKSLSARMLSEPSIYAGGYAYE